VYARVGGDATLWSAAVSVKGEAYFVKDVLIRNALVLRALKINFLRLFAAYLLERENVPPRAIVADTRGPREPFAGRNSRNAFTKSRLFPNPTDVFAFGVASKLRSRYVPGVRISNVCEPIIVLVTSC